MRQEEVIFVPPPRPVSHMVH